MCWGYPLLYLPPSACVGPCCSQVTEPTAAEEPASVEVNLLMELGAMDLEHFINDYLTPSFHSAARDEPDHHQSLVCRYMVELADTVDAMHRAGVVHADLKAANVVIDAQTGRLKVGGFWRLVEGNPTQQCHTDHRPGRLADRRQTRAAN